MKTKKKTVFIYVDATDFIQVSEQINKLRNYCSENDLFILQEKFDYFGSISGVLNAMDELIQNTDNNNRIDYFLMPKKIIRGFRMNILHAVLAYCKTELLII